MQIRLARNRLARRVFGGAAWSAVGSVVASGLGLLTMVALARILGKEELGQFIAVQSTLTAVGVFAGFGLGLAATRFAAEFRGRDSARLAGVLNFGLVLIVALGLSASVLLGVTSTWVSRSVFHAPRLSAPLAIGAISVVLSAVDAYLKSVLIGLELLPKFALVTMVGAACSVPLILGMAHWLGLEGAAVGITVAAAIQCGISLIVTARGMKDANASFGGLGTAGDRAMVLHFAFPAFVSSIFIAPSHWLVQIFLNQATGDFAQLAILGIAMQWFGIVLFIPNVAGRIVLPVLSERVTGGDLASTKAVIVYSTVANALVAIPLAFAIALLSPHIVRLYGSQYADSYSSVAAAVFVAALVAVMTPVGSMLAATSRMWLGALMNACWAVIYVGMSWILAAQGPLGIIAALAVGYVVHAAWTIAFANRYIRVGMVRGATGV